VARRFLRSAGAVSAAVTVSRITGLVREIVMARLFGASALYDAFLLGFRIPNLSRDLFGEGALSSAFVPTFAEYLEKKSKAEAAELARVVATSLALVVSAVCLAGIVFSPQLVDLLAPGFSAIPGKRETAVLLTRIMFPFLALVTLAAQAMGVLNASDRYGVPALASAAFNVVSVACGLALGYTWGRYSGRGQIVSMAWGVVAGGAAQWLWQVPSLYRAGFSIRPKVDWQHPGLRRIGRLFVPAILGNAAVQINILVNTNFASGITDASGHVIDGPVSWLNYAYRFLQLPLGIFGVAIASATLPEVSRHAAAGRMDEFRGAIARSLKLAFLLTIPASVGLAVLGRSMIGAIYEGGRFTGFDTHQTAVALSCYSLGLAGYSAIKILAPSFYALHDSRTPVMVSAASVGVNLAAAVGLVKWAGWGHAGLALATSLVAVSGAVALYALLRARMGRLGGRDLVGTLARIVLASAVMGVVCRLSTLAMEGAMAPGKLAHLANVAVSIPLGALVFYLVMRLLGVRKIPGFEGHPSIQ
jgi:putative peptidoglycan lipid II flippase